MTLSDSQILAKLKAEADKAWIHSRRLAKLADADWNYRDEWLAALRKAQTATKRYQAFMGEEGTCQS